MKNRTKGKILLTLLLIIIVQSLSAQENISVVSMEDDPTDLTAQQRNKKDEDGNTCALLRVCIVDDGTKFEGNLLDVDTLTNEYWVWMKDGSEELALTTSFMKHLDVKFSDYGISNLQGRKVYILTLNSPDATRNVQSRGNTLKMKVKPRNATIIIDGKKEQPRFGFLSLFLPYGSHTYKISAQGYEDEEGTFDIGQQPTELEINLIQ